MLEIAFTESACGALKMAQSFGKGPYQRGCIGVIISRGDVAEPTQEEIEEAQHQAEEAERRKWESAIPLGGKSCDVFSFSLGLSFGDIREPVISEKRIDALKILYSLWDDILEEEEQDKLKQAKKDLRTVREHLCSGGDIRVWYSDIPDELCGFYWLMDQLRTIPEGHGRIYALKQPKLEESDNRIRQFCGWGEVEPGEFHKYVDLAVPVSDFLRRYYGNVWEDLQEENALIRACVNGNLVSAPEDQYDYHIQKEIDIQPDEFREAVVVGNVLGKYTPGISDGYIHYRIEKMVNSGKLIAVTASKEGDPGYWRTLRKV